jgi:hypothetical protein
LKGKLQGVGESDHRIEEGWGGGRDEENGEKRKEDGNRRQGKS